MRQRAEIGPCLLQVCRSKWAFIASGALTRVGGCTNGAASFRTLLCVVGLGASLAAPRMTAMPGQSSAAGFGKRGRGGHVIFEWICIMFAIVRTGGKQYRVAAGDKIAVEKLAGEAGETITLGDVLLAGEEGVVADASKVVVSAEIIAQAKSEKVIVFKKRRRHNYRRKNGHRQLLTLLRIVSVAAA
jgi:large subunit ribosomal protein L21